MLHFQRFPTRPAVKAHLIVNCIVVALMIIVVGLRVWSRIYLKAGLGWDDGIIIFAVPIGIGMLIIQGIWSQLGIGYDLPEVMVNIGLVLRLLFAYQLMYCITIAAAKFSVLFFYMRIFVEPKIRLLSKILMGIVIAGSVGNLISPFVMCRPFAGIYDPTVKAECGDELASLVSMGIFQVITDGLILGLPIYSLWGLKMQQSRKFGLMGVFMIGFLTTIVGIIRLANLTTVKLHENLTGTMVYADFLTTLEPNLGILCVSLPMLAGLFKGWFGREPGTGKSGYGSSNRMDMKSGSRQKFKKMDDDLLMETRVDNGQYDAASDTELTSWTNKTNVTVSTSQPRDRYPSS